MKNYCFAVLGIVLGLLTPKALKRFFPRLAGLPYLISTLFSLLLIVGAFILTFMAPEKSAKKYEHQ